MRCYAMLCYAMLCVSFRSWPLVQAVTAEVSKRGRVTCRWPKSEIAFVVVLSHVVGDEDRVELKQLSPGAVIGQSNTASSRSTVGSVP